MLRVLAFIALVWHACTGWLWLYLFHWLMKHKPDLLSQAEFEVSVGFPMAIAYAMIVTGLLLVIVIKDKP